MENEGREPIRISIDNKDRTEIGLFTEERIGGIRIFPAWQRTSGILPCEWIIWNPGSHLKAKHKGNRITRLQYWKPP